MFLHLPITILWPSFISYKQKLERYRPSLPFMFLYKKHHEPVVDFRTASNGTSAGPSVNASIGTGCRKVGFHRFPATFLAGGAISSSSEAMSPYSHIASLFSRASVWNFSNSSKTCCLSLGSHLRLFSNRARPS